MKDRTPLGRNIQSVMGPSPYNQVSLGKEIGISQSTLSRLLTGQMKPELELIEKIAKVLRVPLYLLVAGTELESDVPPRCVFTISHEDHFKWLGYFASALTGATEEQRQRIDSDAAIARNACEGIQAFLYEPGWYTDPVANKNLCLLDGEDADPKMRQSRENLFEFGEGESPKLGPAELQTLWQQYVAEVTPKRLAVAETRLEVVSKSEWRDRARNNKKRTGKLFDV